MYKKIMIATDGSELSDKAVHQGLELASSLNASVVVTRVIPRYPTAYFEGAVVLDRHKEGEQSMQKALDLAAKKAVKARTSLVTSDFVAESLINAAKKHRCDLIVMASHGYKAFRRLLLGSETLNVLTHSHIPVLVLR
jgi:nucleotide-binding universal stress UspA family protein